MECEDAGVTQNRPNKGRPRWVGKNLVRLILLGTSTLLGACMIGTDFQRPPAAVASQWLKVNNPLVDTSRQDYREWWTLFNDPALTKLIYLARTQNLDELMAGVRVLEARAQLGIAIGNSTLSNNKAMRH
jgi:hypothetical protein